MNTPCTCKQSKTTNEEKENALKLILQKIDREIWAKVGTGEASQSWARNETKKLILEYVAL